MFSPGSPKQQRAGCSTSKYFSCSWEQSPFPAPWAISAVLHSQCRGAVATGAALACGEVCTPGNYGFLCHSESLHVKLRQFPYAEMELINQSCLLDNNRASGGSQRNAAFQTMAKHSLTSKPSHLSRENWAPFTAVCKVSTPSATAGSTVKDRKTASAWWQPMHPFSKCYYFCITFLLQISSLIW